MRPLSFLDITSQNLTFPTAERKLPPAPISPAGFSRVQISAQVFRPGRSRTPKTRSPEPDPSLGGAFPVSPGFQPRDHSRAHLEADGRAAQGVYGATPLRVEDRLYPIARLPQCGIYVAVAAHQTGHHVVEGFIHRRVLGDAGQEADAPVDLLHHVVVPELGADLGIGPG